MRLEVFRGAEGARALMKTRFLLRLAAAAALVLAAAAPVGAQVRVGIDPGHPDPSYAKSAALTVGVAMSPAYFGTIPNQTPLRGLFMNCSVAGNVVVTLTDGSTLTIAAQVGVFVLPLAVQEVVSETATCTFAALG